MYKFRCLHNEHKKVIKRFAVPLQRIFKKGCCNYVRTSDGHQVWSKKELTRPIIFQTHIDPIPEFIIRNALRSLGISKNQFWEILEGK